MINKKIKLNILPITILFVVLLLVPPLKVSAIGGTVGGLVQCFAGDISSALSIVEKTTNVPIGWMFGSITTSGIETATKLDCIKNNVLKPMAQIMARQAVKNMTQSTINWINTGGIDGNPLFITDPQSYFNDISIQQRDLVINELNGIHSPISKQVVKSIILGDQNSFARKSRYTLDKVSGSRAKTEAFLRGDRGSFTWDRWLALTTNPANNPYGLYSITQDEISKKANSAKKSATQEASWSKGLLTSKRCSKWALAPGKFKSHPDGLCDKYETVSPGTAIEGQMQLALGSDLRQLELADEFDKIFEALVGKAFDWGSGGLIGQTRAISSVKPPGYNQNKEDTIAGLTKAEGLETRYLTPKTTSRNLLRGKALLEMNIDNLILLYQEQIKLVNKSIADTGHNGTGYTISSISNQISQVILIKKNTINGIWIDQLITLEQNVINTQKNLDDLKNIKNKVEKNDDFTILSNLTLEYTRMIPVLNDETSIYLAKQELEAIQKIIADIDSRILVARNIVISLGGNPKSLATTTPAI